MSKRVRERLARMLEELDPVAAQVLRHHEGEPVPFCLLRPGRLISTPADLRLPTDAPALPCAAVERRIPRRVVRRVDDAHDLRRDPAHHNLEPLAQGHLRCRASLASAAHGDE